MKNLGVFTLKSCGLTYTGEREINTALTKALCINNTWCHWRQKLLHLGTPPRPTSRSVSCRLQLAKAESALCLPLCLPRQEGQYNKLTDAKFHSSVGQRICCMGLAWSPANCITSCINARLVSVCVASCAPQKAR